MELTVSADRRTAGVSELTVHFEVTLDLYLKTQFLLFDRREEKTPPDSKRVVSFQNYWTYNILPVTYRPVLRPSRCASM